jgi:Family of unknown function (DUF6519)
MKGDFSRRTFDATKHYTGVLVEQGRMLTDADSDEEHQILTYRAERGTEDIVGACGGPLPDAGFALGTPDNAELRIGAGPYYAAGTLLENESEIAFTDQPDRYDVPWPPPAGRHAIVLETWRRLVTALDDASIREVALGGPTTSSRERVLWQVGAVPVEGGWVCTDELPPAERTTGELAAQAQPDEELSSPCLIPPQAGYTGLENQFYRVEIFDSGDAYDLEAAPDTVAITAFPAGQPNQLTVAALGSLAVGDPVEVFRTGPDSDPIEATFGYVTDVDGLTLTLSTSLPAFGPTDAPTVRKVNAAFVVSRDNGSVVTRIEAIEGVEVTVHDTGPDDVLGFAVGQLVEVSDDRIELEGLPRQLRQIADIDQARRIVALRTPAEALGVGPSGVDPSRHPKLRRWDAAGGVRFRPDGSGWIHLENGNQVRFVDGHYRGGDYWTFPARAATVDADSGTIEWPQDGGAPALRSPFGIERHRCVLGYVDTDDQGAITHVEDCRNLFPPLTSMRNLLYVGGDGQEGSPTNAVDGLIPLPGVLEVRVTNGGIPVGGAAVRFTVTVGGGRLESGGPTVDMVTDGDGLTSCFWEIDTTEEHQVCIAQLLAPSGDPIPHQIVRFHATIDRNQADGGGCCLSVGPDGDFPTLDEALRELFERGERDICLCLMAGDHLFGGGEFSAEVERRAHLSIHGYGRGTRLRLLEPWRLNGWAAIRLVDFDMLLAPDAFVSLVDNSDAEIGGMQVFGRPPGVGLVRVYGFERLQVASSVIVSRVGGGLEGPRLFLEGLDPLATPWEIEDETDLRDALRRVALETAGLSAARRRTLVKQLRERIRQAGDEISRGEINAFMRLADVIERRGAVTAILHELDLIVKAAVVTRPGVALEIGSREGDGPAEAPVRVSVVITDNLVPGIISFYGLAGPDELVPADVLARLDVLVMDNAQLLGIAGDVHIRGNRFGRLALGREMIALMHDLVPNPRIVVSVYESFHVSDNMIDSVVSETVARHTALTSNDFTLEGLPVNQPPPNGEIAHVIGDTASYTANHARLAVAANFPNIVDITRASAEVANLELHIV